MVTAEMYKNYLSSYGSNLAQVKKNQSDAIMNNSFTADAQYKKVYILTKDGWKWEDAKYQRHTKLSILKDAVDYYLQFRPKVHYPIGSYVFVPDDTDFDINISGHELDNPLSLPDERITQLWFIVGRDDANAFVRYNILKCNWKFQWIYDNKLYKCWGSNRSANSYTSGRWDDQYTSSLDNLTAAWLPDIYYAYGNNLYDLGLSDDRTIMHEQRFMLTNNILDPKVYQVTKIIDLNPSGVIKLSIKQDELNKKVDNVQLRICNYYKGSGDQKTEIIQKPQTMITSSQIEWMYLNDDGEIEPLLDRSKQFLYIGKNSYFEYKLPYADLTSEWNISLVDKNSEYTEEEKSYYEGLIKLTVMDNVTISLKPGKAHSLIGKRFNLSATDNNGDNHSSIEVEVQLDE